MQTLQQKDNQKALKVEQDFEFSYKEYVDTTYLTFIEAIKNCISKLTSEITARGVFDVDFQKDIQLLNLLNGQLCQAENFVGKYNKVDKV